MKHNWEKSLEVILHHEGGFVNHPKDPCGETNMGVTKRVYEDFGGTKDMKDLTHEDVEPIYKKNYWDRVKGDDLPEGLDLMIFDFAVNAGTGRAAKFIQRLVNTTVDGGIGPNTLYITIRWFKINLSFNSPVSLYLLNNLFKYLNLFKSS